MDDPGPRAALERLADTLWAQRHVVDLLLYRLTAAKLFLSADERRFVTLALDEVEHVVGGLRVAEDRRAAAVADVASAIPYDPANVLASVDVHPGVRDQPGRLAASGAQDRGPHDGRVAKVLAALRTTIQPGGLTLDGAFGAVVVDLAGKVASAERLAGAQESLARSAGAARMGSKG